MDIKEIMEKLLSFDTSGEAIVLGTILLITFLLGIFVLALLSYWPSRRKWRKEEKKLNERLETLDKDFKILDEKNTVQSAKSKRLEDELAKNEVFINEQKTKLAQIQQLYTFLEAERDAKHKKAEAAERELHELKNLFKIHQLENQEAEEKVVAALQERDIAIAKVEEIKGLLEEIEQDRHAATGELEQSATILSEAKHQLSMAQVELETLRKELKIAEDKLHIIASTDAEGLAQENVKLNGELIDLQVEIIRLQAEKQELDEKLMAYKEADSRVLEQAANNFQNQEALLMEINAENTLEKEEPLTELPETLTEPLGQATAKVPLIEEDGFVEPIAAELVELAEVQVEKKSETIDVQQNSLILQQQHTNKEETADDLWEKNAFKTAIEQAVVEELSRTMPAAKEGQKDDLKRINGIGYEIEKKLNTLGIVTYEQIAILNDSGLNNRIGMLLAAFDGNIERDQWVAQAKQLITKQKINNLTKDIKMTKLFRK